MSSLPLRNFPLGSGFLLQSENMQASVTGVNKAPIGKNVSVCG